MGFSSSQVANASLVAQVGGSAMGAVGSFYSAKSQSMSLKAQARMDDLNAQLAEKAAQTELARGQREVQSSRLKTAQLKSTQRASMAANGIDLGSDTAVNILSSTDLMGEIDADTLEANAVRSAWGYRTQAVNASNSAIGARATAKGINPAAGAAGSLLSSAGQVASSWYSMKKAGTLSYTDVEGTRNA